MVLAIERLVLCLALMGPAPLPSAHAAAPTLAIGCVRHPPAIRPGGHRPAATACVEASRRMPSASHHPTRGAWPTVGLLCLLLVVAPGLPRLLTRCWERQARARARRLVLAEIGAHRQRLGIRRLQLSSIDDYGTPQPQRWEREIRSFCRHRLQAMLARHGLDRFWTGLRADAERAIERAAARGSATGSGFDPGMDPLAYERLCATLLQRAGWTTRLTAASGDQGADILATRRGILLVVQCKLYRGAVGNAAVQQVSAARLHQRATVAIVVSNARFTAAARDLARTNDVALLHHDELSAYRPPSAARATIRSATW
jgi:restriction system protein